MKFIAFFKHSFELLKNRQDSPVSFVMIFLVISMVRQIGPLGRLMGRMLEGAADDNHSIFIVVAMCR